MSRLKGRLARWNDERGFGFLSYADGETFAHIKDFRGRRPAEGQTYSFTLAPGRDGKTRAVDIRPEGLHLSAPIIAAGVALAWLCLVYWLEQESLAKVGSFHYFLTLSSLSFLVFGWDKSQATRDGRRVPEVNLILLTVAGGWPGGLLARHFFQHKTRKQPFRFGFWLFTVLSIAVFIFMFTVPGQAQLSTWLSVL